MILKRIEKISYSGRFLILSGNHRKVIKTTLKTESGDSDESYREGIEGNESVSDARTHAHTGPDTKEGKITKLVSVGYPSEHKRIL